MDSAERIAAYLPVARKLVNRVWFRIGRRVDREDLCQEAYLAVIAADERWDESKSAYASFMHRRVNGALIDYLRSQDMLTRSQRQEAGSFQPLVPFADEDDEDANGLRLSSVPDPGLDPFEQAVITEFLEQPRAQRTREILRLAFREGLPMCEIADRVGVSPSRVTQIISTQLAFQARRFRNPELAS